MERVVTDFYTALQQGDGAAACALLAPATRSALEQSSGSPCGEAILEEGLPTGPEPAEVTVFETAARATGPSDTAFLGQFAEGWKVVAAGCTPQAPEHPYDCLVAKG